MSSSFKRSPITSLELAAFLKYNGLAYEIVPSPAYNRVAFNFKECPELEEAIHDFKHDIEIPIRTFAETIKMLRDEIFHYKRSLRDKEREEIHDTLKTVDV